MAHTKSEKELFYETHAPLAMEQQIKYGIPASITLEQMYIESGCGDSAVAKNANNYFGIKNPDYLNVKDPAKQVNNDKVYWAYDRDGNGKSSLQPFRRFPQSGGVEASMEYHSRVLMGSNYVNCKSLTSTDYAGWANGMQSAKHPYAESSNYANILIKDINAYKLYEYDRMAVEEAKKRGVECGYMRSQANEIASRQSNTSSKTVQSSRTTSGNTVLIGFGMPLRDKDNLILTSDYGYRGVGGIGSANHKGIDLRAAVGTSVYASETGIVIGKDYQAKQSNGKAGAGHYVVVAYPRADGSYDVARYMHLSHIEVKVGDRVTSDSVIAKTGNSGGVGAHLHFDVCRVTGSDASRLDRFINEKVLTNSPVSVTKDSEMYNTIKGGASGSNYGHHVDPKQYLAEISVAGDLNNKLVDSANQDRDLLAKKKENINKEVLLANYKDVEQQNNNDLAQADNQQEEQQEQHDRSVEDTILKTVKSNGVLSALLDKDGSGLGQMFEGGSDLTSSLIQMLFMSFLALAFNKQEEKEDLAQKDVQQPKKKSPEDDYTVRENRNIGQEAADMASTKYDIASPEQSESQQQSQQQQSGISVG